MKRYVVKQGQWYIGRFMPGYGPRPWVRQKKAAFVFIAESAARWVTMRRGGKVVEIR